MPDMPQIPRVEARVVHHGGVPVTHTGRGRRETVKLAATAAQSIAPVDLTGGDVPRVELHGGDAEVDGAAARGGRRDAVPGVARARTDVTGCAVSNIRTAVTDVLLQCLFDRFGSVFPQCGLMVFPGVVIVSR